MKLNPAELLSAKWGKLLRHKGRADRQAAMTEEMPGRHAPWERLTGSLTNLVSALKREGLPAPAVKAITLALLGYIDGQVRTGARPVGCYYTFTQWVAALWPPLLWRALNWPYRHHSRPPAARTSTGPGLPVPRAARA